jgi:hypothetical protein
MPVSGLVLTLKSDAPSSNAAIAELRAHGSISVGERVEHRLPIVVDTPGSEEDRRVWEWLHTLPGVVFVELVCADMSADGAQEGEPPQLSPIQSRGQSDDNGPPDQA